MRKILDKPITLARRRGLRATRRTSVWRRLCLSLVLGLVLNPILTTPSNAIYLKRYQTDWALVAMNHLGTLEETQCWVELIWRESRFDPKARNGSHYGLAQMRSTWYRDLSPKGQIQASIKYIHHRYGDSCKALDHFDRKGWH